MAGCIIGPHIKSESPATVRDFVVRDFNVVGWCSFFIGDDADGTILSLAMVYSVLPDLDVVNSICFVICLNVNGAWHRRV